MPLRSGLAEMMALARSADLTWSPPPYWRSTISIPARSPSCSRRTRRGVRAGHAGLVVHHQGDLAVPPTASAMCLAASAAAARLSVAAVVSGMSLSTPESNAITGMSCDFACCSSGRRPDCRARRTRSRPGCLSRGLQHADLPRRRPPWRALEGDLDADSSRLARPPPSRPARTGAGSPWRRGRCTALTAATAGATTTTTGAGGRPATAGGGENQCGCR